MKKLIQQFIEKLDKDGVLTKEQIEEFENFGVIIQKYITEAEEKAKDDAEKVAKDEKDVADQEKEDDDKAVEEAIKALMTKANTIKKEEIKLAVCEFRNNMDLTFNEEQVVATMDKYLTGVVEEHLPEQAVIDYDRLHRFEKTFESLRGTLLITNEYVQKKVDCVLEDIQEELTQKSDLLNDSIKRNIEYKAEIAKNESTNLLDSKLADLPEFEANKLRKVFAESLVEEIEADFDTQLETIQSIDYKTKDEIKNNTIVTEEQKLDVVISDVDRYAQLAERFLPKTYKPKD